MKTVEVKHSTVYMNWYIASCILILQSAEVAKGEACV